MKKPYISIAWLLLLWMAGGCQSTTPPPDQPLKVETGTKAVNGVELYYKIVGEGEPLVIVHGGPGDSHSYFLPQMENLATHHQLIFYDQRASGQSTGADDMAAVNAETFVADLEGLRTAFGLEKITLLGHSWGGLLALLYALAHPDRVEALILVAPAPASATGLAELNKRLFGRMSIPERNEVMTALAQAESDPTPEQVERFKQLLYSFYFYDRDSIEELSLIEINPANARVAFEVNRAIWDSLGDYDLREALNHLETRTLIIHCSIDPVPIEAAQQIDQALPNSEFVQPRRCGHFPFVDAPQTFFETVRAFLAGPAP